MEQEKKKRLSIETTVLLAIAFSAIAIIGVSVIIGMLRLF